MLNEKAIDKLIQPIIDRQTQIEMAVIEKIAKRLGEIKTMLPSDIHKLETLLKNGSDAKEINKMLARLTQMQEKEIKKVIKAVAQNTYEDAKPFYDYRNLSFVPFEDNEQLQKTIKAVERATLAEFDNLSNATAFMMRDPLKGNFRFPTPVSKIYQKVIDMAIQSVVMGPESYNEAIPKAIKELVKSGIKTVEYTSDNGKKHYVRLDTAVRRNILDGIRNISHEVDKITGEQFGANGVELSVHNYSAPDHEPIQGHRFTNEEFDKLQTNQPFEDENGNSFAPIERPIGVWNCHHIIISVLLEAMSPTYTKEQLEQIIKENANGYTYTNKKGEKVTKSKYWCTQKMREYELDIKKAREGKKAAELAKEYEVETQYQSEINRKQNEYRQFCEDCGLETEFDRTRVYTTQDEVKGVDVKGLSAKLSGDNVPEHDEPTFLGKIDYSDEQRVLDELTSFEKSAIMGKTERALVITAKGEMYMCYGTKDQVFPDFDLGDKLIGSTITHNHVHSETEYSFSTPDMMLYNEYQLKCLRGCDAEYTYQFTRDDKKIDELEEGMIFENVQHNKIIDLAKRYNIGYRRWKNE